MKIKNVLANSIDITVISETVTTLASGEEKDIPVDSAKERIEIKLTQP